MTASATGKALLKECQDVLWQVDAEAALRWFAGRPENERKPLAGHCLKWFKRVHRYWLSHDEHVPPGFREGASIGDALETSRLAWLATTNAPLSIQTYGWRGIARDDHVVAILQDRRPAWVDRWVEMVCERSLQHWPLIRRLVKAGLCATPSCDGYTLGMIATLAQRDRHGVRDELLSDPDLLRDELWRVFRVEGSRDASLTSSEASWLPALLEMVERRELDRVRVIDETLQALQRDFAQHKAGFYSRLHQKLELGDAERVQRSSSYLALLGSRIGPTQSMALSALETIHRVGGLAAESYVDAVAPALTARSKGTTRRALGLLQEIAEQRPDLRSRCCQAALCALDHSAAEVHEAVAALIEAFGAPDDTTLAEAARGRLQEVAASQRGRLQAWLGRETTAAQQPELSPAETSWSALVKQAAALDPKVRALAGVDDLLARPALLSPIAAWPWLALPRLQPAEAITPIASVDELVDVASHVIEGGAEPEEMERALDGIARLCDQRPDGFEERVKPLRKRLRTLLRKVRRFEWADLANEMQRLAQAWLEDAIDHATRPRPDAIAFLHQRVLHVALRVAERRPFVLLSTPTHRGGLIDPCVLVERARSLDVDDYMLDDAVLALLRLAPDHRQQALREALELPGELGAAIRHALGAEQQPVGEAAALWIAAARARNPDADDPAVAASYPELGPDAARMARYSFSIMRLNGEWIDDRWVVKPATHGDEESRFQGLYVQREPAFEFEAMQPEYLSVLHNSGERGEVEELPLRWLSTTWPAGRRAWFASGAEALFFNLDWSSAAWANHHYLEALLDPDTPLDAMGNLCLACGLSAKEARESALATDALICTIEDGRLSGVALGEVMRRLCDPMQHEKWAPRPRGSRWAKTLSEAARVSALHAEQARVALEHALAYDDPSAAPKDAHEMLALLRELCIEAGCGVLHAPARAFLSTLLGSSKTAKLARACLALQGTQSVHREPALAQALQGRITRARRWQAAISS